MANAYLCPILQQNQFTDNANFLAGGLLWSYVAGTTTPQAVYTDSTANTAWPNPIILDQRGETGGEIWLAAGSEYKFILEEAPFYGETHGPTVATFDNISGINDSSALTIAPNWITFTGTPTYISPTSFSVVGDQRTIFQLNRRIKSANTGGTVYGSVSAASYATGITTITLINDTGYALDSGLNSIAYGFIETDPSSIPITSGTSILKGNGSGAFSNAIPGTDYVPISGTGATGTWGINVSGNAATVTNGIYTTGSYADPSWLTSLAGSKVSGAVALSTNCTNAIGNGQTWQNVTASRAFATTYTNSTGKPIQVAISIDSTVGATVYVQVYVSSVLISGNGSNFTRVADTGAVFSFIVPNTSTYTMLCPGGSLIGWAELR